jgi:hypothetical protein
MKRIANGWNMGELKKNETKYLVQQQMRIQNQKKIAKSDGALSEKERVRIKYSQTQASANIYRKKHNNIIDRTN